MLADATGPTRVRSAVSWTGTVVACVLAVLALYVGTAVVVSIVHWTVQGALGVALYYATTIVAPVVIGDRRSRGASVPSRVRRVAALSLAAQFIFVPIAFAALLM